MADNVLMAYHIVKDATDGDVQVLNTKKLYKWRITDQTKGTPQIGKLAIVKTRFTKRAPVLVFATKEGANDLSDLQPVEEFTDEEPRDEAMQIAFQKLLGN